jgi:hypothetical protein
MKNNRDKNKIINLKEQKNKIIEANMIENYKIY